MSLLSKGAITFRQSLPLLALCLFGLLIFSGLTSLVLETPLLLVLHGIFENASIIIGFIIFYIAWYSASTNNGIRVAAVSLVILSTAILELLHLLSYPGFAVDPLGNDHIWVTSWVFSRLIWSFGLLYTTGLPPGNNGRPLLSNKTLLYCTLGATAALIANIVLSYNFLPYLNIDRFDHPTVLYAQYGALSADLLALFILRRNYPNHVNKLPQFALLFGAISDLSFCLYPHTAFSLNVAGHFFRVLANFYVLRSLAIQVIRQPYDEVLRLKEEMEELAGKNAKLYQESEQQRNLVEDVLSKIGTIISSQMDVKSTLDAIADMVADMMHCRQSVIALFAKDRSSLQVAATYGFGAPPDSIPMENSLAAQVCETKTALFIDDLALHPEIFRPQLIFSNIRSIICAPLINDQEIIGVIEAYSSEKGMFTKRDALLLKALGYHAGAAITAALLFEQTKMRLDEEKFLYQIAQTTGATIDATTIMEQCTAHVARALGADAAVGFLVTDYQKKILTYKTSLGLTSRPTDFEVTYPEMDELIKSPAPTLTVAEKFPPCKELCGDRAGGPIMILPLPVNHRLLGVIVLGWRRFISPERLERTSFAGLLGRQIALGLENAHLYHQIKAMALSDGLTGLANRRNLDMFLKTELRRAAALKRPLSLIMLDLDKFKIYNDTYGHPVGDKLLTELGKMLQQTVRSIDLPARYGGEEFCIILPECSNPEAMALAEKIRQKVETAHFPDNLGTVTAQITASLGVATYDPALGLAPPDIERFVASADEALYQAKNQGRNRVANAPVV
ncbi:MAG: diguanylate cyclase [Negativicutes bacterium]|nr:diguanylate cyclase [Negativicutes bacterium]